MTALTARKWPVLVFLSLVATSLAALLLLPPISQDQSYHCFADERTLLGVQNFCNVVSNLPFIAIGALGLRQFYRDPATLTLFFGVFLTAFGSSYYHWNPNGNPEPSGRRTGAAPRDRHWMRGSANRCSSLLLVTWARASRATNVRREQIAKADNDVTQLATERSSGVRYADSLRNSFV
jgi:hypothetical protein